MENEILARQLKEKQAKELERYRVESVMGVTAQKVNVERQDQVRKNRYLDWVADWKGDVKVEMADTPTFERQMRPQEQTSAEDKAYREEQKRRQQQKDGDVRSAFNRKQERIDADKIGIQSAGEGGIEQLELRIGGGAIGQQAEKRRDKFLKMRIAMNKLKNYVLRGSRTNGTNPEEEEGLRAAIIVKQEDYEASELNGLRKYYSIENPYANIDSEILKSEKLFIKKHTDEKTGAIIRKDAYGRERRQNMAKYRNGGRGSDKAAETDVENLVTNIRLDLALSGKAIEPQGAMLTLKKACAMIPFVCGQIDVAIAAREHEFKDKKEMLSETGATEDTAYKETESEEKRFKSAAQRLRQFSLGLRESCNNAIFYDLKMKEIMAMELAAQMIKDAPASEYTKKMLGILSARVKEARTAIEADTAKRLITLKTNKYGTDQKGWDVMSEEDFGLLQEFAATFDDLQAGKEKTERQRDADGVERLKRAYRKIDDYLGVK
ncbi:MAG: hypothetical protein K6E50_15485 [Lachnospiraceae bacterium]|nr:hypothetical protein [Lachnospiraceae bacterium]